VESGLETGTFEEVFILKDGQEIRFKFIDFDSNGQVDASDRMELIKYSAEGETVEAYDSGDAGAEDLGDCKLNHTVQQGNFVFNGNKEERCPD